MFQFFQRKSFKSTEVNEIESLLGKLELIDIRDPNEFRQGHLPTAKNIPMDKILDSPENYLDKSKEYHIICHSGARSSRACGILKENGYNIINVAGGTSRYRGNLEKI